MGPEATGLCGD